MEAPTTVVRTTAEVRERYQVTIPEPARKVHDIEEGDVVEFEIISVNKPGDGDDSTAPE